MALFTFNADSAGVTASANLTKVGSTYVKNDALQAVVTIAGDAGSGKAFDFSTSEESLSDGVTGGDYIDNTSPTVDATSETSASFSAENAFNTSLSTTGSSSTTSWRSNSITTNQRLVLDNESAASVFGVRISNGHNEGNVFNVTYNGVRNTKIYVSNSAVDYVTTYGNVTGTMTLVFDGEIARHSEVDEADWQQYNFSSVSSARYFIFDFADNWGGGQFPAMNVRRIQLQEEEIVSAPTTTYQSTDDTPPTNFIPITPESLSELQSRTNTDLQLTTYKVYLDGAAGGVWNSFSTEDQTPDVTPPGVPTISNLESVGSDPNLGFFSDWTEPTDTDFDHVKGQLNIDSGGWLDIDNTASLGGATSMKFNESLAGTQAQAEGWLYQNHYARNGYSEGTTAQTRFRSVDNVGNESAYSTSGIITLESTASAPGTPSITDLTPGDGKLTITVAAADETLKVFALYKQTNKSAAWSAESATFSRTGSGDIDITGLSNGTEYDVICYHKDASESCIGLPSNIYSGYPDSDPNGQYRHARKIYQRDQSALMLLQIAKDMGQLMTFRNEGTGTTGITVYGIVSNEYSRNIGIRNGAMDLQEISVSIPRQTNFPPDNFDLNGTVEVDGEEFQVQDYSTNPNTKTYAAEFVLNCSSVRGQEGI